MTSAAGPAPPGGAGGAAPGRERATLTLAEFRRAAAEQLAAGEARKAAGAEAWRGGGAEARAAVERTVAVLEAAAVSEKPTHAKHAHRITAGAKPSDPSRRILSFTDQRLCLVRSPATPRLRARLPRSAPGSWGPCWTGRPW